MWEVIFSVVLVIFLTCTLFFLIYGAAYFIVWKTIDWTQKIVRKIREPAKEKERDKEAFERKVFGPPSRSEDQLKKYQRGFYD